MRRLKGAVRGFLIGLLGGGVLGALGGTLDRGGMLILMPSGPPFWGILGAFVGSIVGTLGGVLFPPAAPDGSAGQPAADGSPTAAGSPSSPDQGEP